MSHQTVIAGMTPPSRVVRALKGLVLTALCALVAVPFLGVLATSLAPRKQVVDAGGFVLWPSSVTFDAYQAIFSGGVVSRALA